MAADFWCTACSKWTAPEDVDDGHLVDPPACSVCGEPYACEECGFEINATGECQRPPDLGACPNSVIPAGVRD